MFNNYCVYSGDRTECRRTNGRGQIVADKMSQDNSLQDKTSRTYRRGENVADKTSQKIRRMDKTSHGQMVAWTKRRTDK